ncbi:MAG TPA: SEC-C domain-containing protein [Fibrobacteria bacterium]|nr:SEC-C domain-containing protein [Fibrobacteria bacterium]
MAVPAATGPAEEMIRRLAPFPLEGFERSFKVSPGRISWNRFLAGISRDKVSDDQVLAMGRELRMPTGLADAYRAAAGEASQILFGCEEAEDGCSYRIYLEYWEKLKRDLPLKLDKTLPVRLHLGFKWDPEDPARQARTDYFCFPLLSPAGIRKRLSGLYPEAAVSPSFALADRLLTDAERKPGEPSFIYVEATEPGNPRSSFDINFYKAGLSVGDALPAIGEALRSFRAPADQWEARLAELRSKALGHVAGGLDRQGREFLTIYYEDAPHRIGKAGRNDPCPCGSGRKFKKCHGA